jgi:hypothetical protein
MQFKENENVLTEKNETFEDQIKNKLSQGSK